MESSDDAIIGKDLHGVIESWNRGAERMFGFTAKEAIGRPMTMICPDDRLAEETLLLAKVARGEQVDHYETERRRKDGSRVHVSVSLSPIRDREGRPVGASLIARDISDRVTAEERLLATNERLLELDRTRSEFLNTVAHELRTPLVPILMRLQFLRRPDVTEEARTRSLDILERNIARLNGLVEQLLDIARMERGSLGIRRVRFDITQVAEEAVETYRDQARRAEIALQFSRSTPIHVVGDPDRLAQVFMNLLSNALKFTPQGGAVSVVVVEHEQAVVASVIDTGRGLTDDVKRRLFQPFSQGDRSKQGAGLGLYISGTIVRLHGGTLAAQSAGEGHGATFTMTLPRALAILSEGDDLSRARLGPNLA